MKLYIGNLPWETTDADLEQLFNRIGDVKSAKVITDRDSGRSRGFGFVEMSKEEGQRAIAELSGHKIGSRELRVNEAREQQPSRSGARF